MIPLIFIIYFGIYLLGLYYFYHKKAYIISRTTFYAATINIILTILFVYVFGVIGAAFATLIAYICYLYIIKKECLKIEENLNINLSRNILMFIVITIILSLGFYNV